jgi:hypothetical protein
MIEEGREEASPQSDTSTTSDEMAEALDAVRASSPSLAEKIEAAEMSPDELAGAHGRATSEKHNAGPSAPESDREQA